MRPLPSNKTHTPTDQLHLSTCIHPLTNHKRYLRLWWVMSMRPLAIQSHMIYMQSSNEMNTIKKSLFMTDHVRSNNFRKGATNELHLKGQCLEIFCFWFFSWVSFPPAPQSIPIGLFAEIFASQGAPPATRVANCRRYQRHWWQICHWYQWHRRQILPPVLL